MHGSSMAAGSCLVRWRIFRNMSRCNDTLAALVAGTPVAWDSLGLDADGLLELCTEEGTSALVYRSVRQFPAGCGWPQDVLDRLARAAHGQTAAEMLRRHEVCETLKSLA